MNHKKNKHFRETDQQLRVTLLEILNEQQIPTIAEICRRCHINRSTFYLHYIDIIDLTNQVKASIYQSFSESVKDNKDVFLLSYDSFLYFAKHVRENKNFYRFFFLINKSFPLQDGFEEMWEPILLPYYQSIGIYDEEIILIRFVAFQAGFTNALSKWVEKDCHLSCEEMATILTECIAL